MQSASEKFVKMPTSVCFITGIFLLILLSIIAWQLTISILLLKLTLFTEIMLLSFPLTGLILFCILYLIISVNCLEFVGTWGETFPDILCFIIYISLAIAPITLPGAYIVFLALICGANIPGLVYCGITTLAIVGVFLTIMTAILLVPAVIDITRKIYHSFHKDKALETAETINTDNSPKHQVEHSSSIKNENIIKLGKHLDNDPKIQDFLKESIPHSLLNNSVNKHQAEHSSNHSNAHYEEDNINVHSSSDESIKNKIREEGSDKLDEEHWKDWQDWANNKFYSIPTSK